MTQILRGDHVFHPGTGETWVVRRVMDGGWLSICGWPPTMVRATEVRLVDRPPLRETQRFFGDSEE